MEVSHKKAHCLVEVEMSSHLLFYKLKWAFLWLTSAVPNQQEFMQRVDLGKTLLDKTKDKNTKWREITLLGSEAATNFRFGVSLEYFWSQSFDDVTVTEQISQNIGGHLPALDGERGLVS